jgi:hypothetical protein
MAITLVSDALGDAEVTDNVGLGEVDSAARLWVRHWSVALSAARQYVEPVEVPGLAAEALIGTIAAIAIGRGPREDVDTFVTAAVRELGEDDDTAPDPSRAALYPEVFGSAMLTRAFTELDAETQESLRAVARDHVVAQDGARALTVLQHYYLAEHSESAESPACRRSHIALMAVVEGSTKILSGASWMHLSDCAWCTEAFHEVAFSNIRLDALIDSAVLDGTGASEIPAAAPITAAPVTTAPVVAGPLFADEPVFEPWAEPAVGTPLAEAGPAPRRRRRGRALTGAAVAAAAIAVVAVLLTNGADGTSPAASSTVPETTTSPSPSPSATFDEPSTTPDTAVGGPATPGTSVPTVTDSTAPPKPTKSATATDKPTDKSPDAKPTKTSPKPTPKPTPSATPTTTAPTPTPTPTAAPTKPCNALQHLFGIC